MLAELLAALALFGITVTALVPLLATTIRAVEQARRTSAATSLARDKLEQIRNTAYAAVASGTDTVSDAGTATSYARAWTVTDGPTSTMRAVAVTVTWTDRAPHQVGLQTLVAQ